MPKWILVYQDFYHLHHYHKLNSWSVTVTLLKLCSLRSVESYFTLPTIYSVFRKSETIGTSVIWENIEKREEEKLLQVMCFHPQVLEVLT
jgi:hypothetical protein